jgi:hypothetical protein
MIFTSSSNNQRVALSKMKNTVEQMLLALNLSLDDKKCWIYLNNYGTHGSSIALVYATLTLPICHISLYSSLDLLGRCSSCRAPWTWGGVDSVGSASSSVGSASSASTRCFFAVFVVRASCLLRLPRGEIPAAAPPPPTPPPPHPPKCLVM